MELRRRTRANWFVSPIYLVGVPSALLGPIVCMLVPAVRQTGYTVGGRAFPVAGPTVFGTACRTMCSLLRRPSVSV